MKEFVYDAYSELYISEYWSTGKPVIQQVLY